MNPFEVVFVGGGAGLTESNAISCPVGGACGVALGRLGSWSKLDVAPELHKHKRQVLFIGLVNKVPGSI